MAIYQRRLSSVDVGCISISHRYLVKTTIIHSLVFFYY